MPSDSYTSAGTFTWTCPTGITSVQIECWGPGGNGAASKYFTTTWVAGGGGGGGAYAKVNTFSVTPGNGYTVVVGGGNSTTKSTFNSTTCVADYGVAGAQAVSQSNPGVGGSGGASANCTGDVTTSGSNGGNGGSPYGGSGGASPNGGGTAGGGFGNGSNGNAPGGGAAGGAGGASYSGGIGADGKVLITYSYPAVSGSGALTQGTTALSGTGNEAFIATAALSNHSVIASSGALGFTGTASLRTSTALGGSSQELFTGTSTLRTSSTALSGTGSGEGNYLVTSTVLAGTGTLAFTGTGALTSSSGLGGAGNVIINFGTATLSNLTFLSGTGALGPPIAVPQYLWPRARRT